MRVREALQSDAQAITEIYNESIEARDSTMELAPKSVASVLQLMAGLRERERLVVLEEGSVVQGWGILKLYSEREGYRRACETSVFLRRRLVGRRSGYGSAIQESLLALAREARFHHVVVRIWASNEISIRMHRKFGFKLVGTQREIGYVDGRWEDVTIMQLLLG